jgi:hypothetical protein
MWRGDRGLAVRAVGRAFGVVGGVAADTPAAPWLAGVDTPAVHARTAGIYLSIGAYGPAVEHAREALDAMPAARVRERALTVADLAEAYLWQREVDEAAEQAGTALELACQLRAGLETGRVAGRLRRLAGLFAVWGEVAQARDWLATYRGRVSGAAEA